MADQYDDIRIPEEAAQREEIEQAVRVAANSGAWKSVEVLCEFELNVLMDALSNETDYAMIRYYQGMINVYTRIYNMRNRD